MRMRLIVASLVLIAGSGEARSMHCAPVSRAAIDQQFATFNRSWLTRDPDKVTALFAPGAVLLATLSDEPRTTRAGIRDYFAHFLKKAPDGHIDTSTTTIGCNEAARMGTWTRRWSCSGPRRGASGRKSPPGGRKVRPASTGRDQSPRRKPA